MEPSRRGVLAGLSLAAASAIPASAATKSTDIKDLQAAIDKAIQGDGVLRLGPREYRTAGLRINGPLRLEGVVGATRLVGPAGAPLLVIEGAADVSLAGLGFIGDKGPASGDNKGAALLMARGCTSLAIADCRFSHSTLNGLRLGGCDGRIADNQFTDISQAAIFALDSEGLSITGNTITNIGNNGILVWTSEPREDGTLVTGNRISQVAAEDGGDGQNGNGINVYRAGSVIVSGNRISDCAFTAVRNNAGSDCQITGNSVSRMGEVAIYCEFGFQGAVVSGNLIDTVRHGISITNFREGGRLAVCANNVIRNSASGGISAEADTSVTGNVIEAAIDAGIQLGWGPYARDLLASGNVIRGCGRGIVFSMTEGAGPVMITGNRISGTRGESILGMDHDTAVTGDLGLAGAAPAQGLISGNLIN
jgi:uncharacterized secreted repeat protein (TIGR03808 family)